MGIQFNEAMKSFKIDAKDTSYIISIVDDEQFLGHVYFGEKIPDQDMNHLLRLEENPFVPSKNNRDRGTFMDSFPNEYSSHGLGDYRESSIRRVARKS